MRRALLSLLLWLVPFHAWAAEPLRLALFPNLSPRTLITMYQPLRLHLERVLGRSVELETAPDFQTFTQRLLRKDYDAAVVAPHLARLAQADSGYHLLAHYLQPVEACLVTQAQSNASIRRGMRLAVPDDVAVVTMLGAEMLAVSGMSIGKDYSIVEVKSHHNVALSIINGQVEMGILGCVPMAQLAPEVQSQLRLVARSRAIPSQYFIAAGHLSSGERAKLLAALLDFAKAEAGRKFIQEYGMQGLVAAKRNELVGMDGFVARVRNILRQEEPR